MKDTRCIGDGRDRGFLTAEDGAVTADYVVLSAMVIALAAFCVQVILNGSEGIGETIAGSLETAEIGELVID